MGLSLLWVGLMGLSFMSKSDELSFFMNRSDGFTCCRYRTDGLVSFMYGTDGSASLMSMTHRLLFYEQNGHV